MPSSPPPALRPALLPSEAPPRRPALLPAEAPPRRPPSCPLRLLLAARPSRSPWVPPRLPSLPAE
ncbi:MAG: hypothetical protein IJ066_04805 [Bacteroidaceae bacterium]|nr:hypothetical protein [Bacteroidaceae bacterium]